MPSDRVKATRIYTGPDGRSHFEEVAIPLKPSGHSGVSDPVPGPGVIFRATAGAVLDFHPAPRRQLVIPLEGAVELQCGDGAASGSPWPATST